MPRNNHSSAKKNKEKSTPSHSAKNHNSKGMKTNSSADPEQRTDEGERPKGGGNLLFPPTHPAATAASPQPLMDMSLKDTSEPIAKPEDPSYDTKKENTSTSQDAFLATPNHDTPLTPEVTFHLPRASSASVSRRQRSRTAKAGRTSKALSRDEQLMVLGRTSSTD